ncbi:hypothetical protein QUA56_33665 [Microcoleus sp. N3A4]
MIRLQTLLDNDLGKFVASSVLKHRAGRAYQIFLKLTIALFQPLVNEWL